MTATDILVHWRAVEPALRTHKSWVTLLLIAEAGAPGIGRATLAKKGHLLGSPTARKWIAAGLIESEQLPPTGRGGNDPVLFRITAKGLRFLRVTHSPLQ